MNLIRKILPHITIALLLGLIVLVLLDGRNPLMAFLTSDVSKIYLYCCCGAGILCSALYVLDQRK